MSAPILYLVRHGETDWNAEGRLQGGRDIPLNALGRAQAAAAARLLKGLVRDTSALDFVASPLGRTRATMEILRETLGLERDAYRADARLVEIGFGEWEGLTWPEIRARDPERTVAREADKWGYRPPGGESYADLRARIAPAFEALERDTVVVSHGGVTRAALTFLCDHATEQAPHMDIWQGRVLVVQSRRWRWV